MNNELVEKLKEVDWDRFILELARFASKRIERLSWKHARIPKGLTADGIALQAIEKVFDEERRWDPQKDPDLMKYLKSTVNSLISKLYKSKEYQITERFEEGEDGEDLIPLPADSDSPHSVAILGQPIANPEQILLKKEEEQQAKEMTDKFLESLEDDEELGEIVLCLLEDITKPADIAQELGVEVEEIYTRRKRLIRRYGEFKNIIKKEGIQWRPKTEKEGGTQSASRIFLTFSGTPKD